MSDDLALLRDYARNNSEGAFGTLVSRHVNLVYSVALRKVRDPHQAEEITQAVFVLLARKANSLPDKTVLSGWLCRTAGYISANALKIQWRRQQREQEAYMQSTVTEPQPVAWESFAQQLDDALGRLSRTDADAIVLRFFENKNLKEVGVALGTSEDAAKKRVSRALEKLRGLFAKRGIHSTAAALGEMIAANSVLVAPPALAESVKVAALAKGATASASTLTLIKGALKVMAWSKVKTALIAGTIALIAASTATIAVQRILRTPVPEQLWRRPDINSAQVDKLPPEVKILPTAFPAGGNYSAGRADGKLVGIGQSIATLASAAYDWPRARVLFPGGAPAGQYDFIATFARNSRPALRRELENKLGWVGHAETTNQDVLLLQLSNPRAPGLRPPVSGTYCFLHHDGYRAEIKWANEPIARINDFLQSDSPLPIIDATGTTNRCSIDVQWTENPLDPTHAALQQALRDQLGLELVPTNMPIEMLVMEKVR